MTSVIKLLFALLLFFPFFVFGYSYHLYKEIRFKHNFSMNEYNDTVSYQIDVLGCALIYNIRGHSLSAMSCERDHWWFMYLINLLFWDKNHCYMEWVKEFKTKE